MRRAFVGVCVVLLLLFLASGAFALSVSGWGEQVRGEGRGGKLDGKGFSVPRGKVGRIVSVECNGDGFWIEGDVYQQFSPATSAIGFQLAPGDYEVFPTLRPGQKKARANITVELSGASTSGPSTPTPAPVIALAGKWRMSGRQTDIPRSDWEADLILYPDGTLSWSETKGANVGATRTGTWLFDGNRFAMSYVAPISGRVQWASRTVTRSSMRGNYGTEEWSGTWSAKKVSEPETGIPVQPPAGSVSGWGEQVRGEGGDGKLNGKGFSVPRGKVGTIVAVECDGVGFWIEGNMYQEFTPATSAIGFQLVPGDYKVFPNLRPGRNKAGVTVTVALSDPSAAPATPSPAPTPGPSLDPKKEPADRLVQEGAELETPWAVSGQGTLVAPGSGGHNYRIHELDASRFINGGTLVIDFSIGSGQSWASVDLYGDGQSIATSGVPQALASAWDLPPGSNRRLTHTFQRGQIFRLCFEGNWGSPKGATNTYTYSATITAAKKPPAENVSGWGEQLRGEGRDGKLNGKGFSVPRGKVGTIISVECNGDGFWIEGDVYQQFTPATSAIGFQLPPGDYKVFPNLRPGRNKAGVTVTVALSDPSAGPVSPSPTPTPGPALDPKKERADRLVQEGAELQKAGKYVEAIGKYRESLKIHPDKLIEEHVKQLDEYVKKLNEQNARADRLVQEGAELQKAGKYVEAIGKYRESLKIRPDKRIEEHAKKLEEYVKKLEEQRADPIDALLGNWVFGRNKTDFIGVVSLTKEKGKFGYVIRGYYHPNESFWKFDGKQIVFIHRDGSPTTYFDRRTVDYWEGQFLPDASIIHYLQR